MVTLIKYGALSGGVKYNANVMFIDGLAAEQKPTDKIEGMPIANGSVFTEIDTGKTYMFNAESKTWHEVDLGGGGGGGGGSSDAYATSLLLSIDSSTYVVTAQLLNEKGEPLGTQQTIDLPLESMVVGGSYNAQTKKVILTLKNGNTVEFSVADLVAGLQTELSASNKLNPAYINYDSTHRAVSDAEKTAWNTTTTNETADRAALVEIVDSKDKNRLPFNNLDTIKAQNTGGTWADNTYTWNGVTFTINEDFSITVNGTATGGNGVLVLSEPGGFSIEEGNWVLSGCPEGGSSTSYSISIATTVSDTGASAQFTSCSAKLVRLYVIEGTTVTDLTFKPMICSKADWDISQKYIPNKPYITVNGIRVYVSATQPTGARTGDLWIGG